MDDSNQCTICLTERSDVVPVYGAEGFIALNVYLITSVKIVEIKGRKRAMICKRCLADLNLALDFRNRCRKSDEILKEQFADAEEVIWKERNLDMLKTDDENEIYHSVIKVEPDLDFASAAEEEEDLAWNYEDYDDTANYFTKTDIFNAISPKRSKVITCPYCSKRLQTRRSLKYHIQVKHEPETSGRFECDHCGKGFPNKHPLKRHLLQAHLSTRPKFLIKSETNIPCPICKVVLKHRKSYRNHIRKKHPKWLKVLFERSGKEKREKTPPVKVETIDTEEYPCSVCGKVFKSKRSLTQHEKTHRVLLPHEYFYCDLCGNKFKEKILMWSHIKKRHIQKIRYQCEQCTCSYTTNHSLQIHIKVRHKNIRDWICNWCGKDFGEKKKLVAHERIHTGEQPFHCHICDAKFTHQTDYRRHKWNHEGRKSFKCQICGEGFVKRSELISHKNRVHAWRNQPQLDQFGGFTSNMSENIQIN